MQVSILIINYNDFERTCECIKSVKEQTIGVAYQIVLIDNASLECNPEKFKQIFPEINLIKSNRNGGFAYANNLGLEKATGEYVLLLNNDTILIENAIAKSLEYFQQQTDPGVLSCRMIYPNGKVQYTARRFRSIKWELLDFFRFILFLMPYKKRSRLMLGKYFHHDENVESDWVNGAFFMLPRKIINQMPGKRFDARFFMYGEDQLWCWQIKNMGYRIYFYSESTIIHLVGGGSNFKRQLKIRRMMMKHELEIMKTQKGKGFYFYTFSIIFVTKEIARNFVKSIFLKVSGRLIR